MVRSSVQLQKACRRPISRNAMGPRGCVARWSSSCAGLTVSNAHAPYWPGLTGCDSLPHSLLPRGQPTNRSLGVGRRDLDLLVSPEVSRMHYPKCRTAGRQTAFPLSRRNRASRLWHHSFVPNPRSRTLSN